jgi:hypothetical protein
MILLWMGDANLGEFGVDEADSRDTDDAKVGAETQQPVHGQLVVDFEFEGLLPGVVPGVHDGSEDANEGKRDPAVLWDLEQRRRQVHRLDGTEDKKECKGDDQVFLPDHEHDECHEERCQHHDRHHRHTCQKNSPKKKLWIEDRAGDWKEWHR